MSTGVTVGVVVVFALGVLGLARVETAREGDGGTDTLGFAAGRALLPGLRGRGGVRDLPDRAAVPLIAPGRRRRLT